MVFFAVQVVYYPMLRVVDHMCLYGENDSVCIHDLHSFCYVICH